MLHIWKELTSINHFSLNFYVKGLQAKGKGAISSGLSGNPAFDSTHLTGSLYRLSHTYAPYSCLRFVYFHLRIVWLLWSHPAIRPDKNLLFWSTSVSKNTRKMRELLHTIGRKPHPPPGEQGFLGQAQNWSGEHATCQGHSVSRHTPYTTRNLPWASWSSIHLKEYQLF